MYIMVVLMVQKSGKHQLSLVVDLPLYLQKVLNYIHISMVVFSPYFGNINSIMSIQVLGWPVVGLWSDPNYDAFGEPGRSSGLLGVVKNVYFLMFPQK